MGYLKLTMEDYEEHPEYWRGTLGVQLPAWASELSSRGFRGVSALDFYDDIFGEDLEEKRMPEDYRTGEYGGIAVEQKIVIGADGKEKKHARRITVTEGKEELYDLIEYSENFCMIAPMSYAGKSRNNKNARYMYALCIEIDGIISGGGITELIYSWERPVARTPKPTYIVCSGNGLHLYYVFERPIPMFRNIFESFTKAKRFWTRRLWSSYVTYLYKKPQYESLNQPFRCVGSVAKSGKAYAMAFEIGEKVTIESLNETLPDDLKLDIIYKSNTTLAKAKELYPEWYQRRIIEGKGRGHWNRHEGIYNNWIMKMYEEAEEGHRYNCLENLCSLAVQCQIEPERVEADCRKMARHLESLTTDEKNHFTEYDILCALRTYHTADEGAYRRKLEYISDKTGIPLQRAKRNGRTQADHLKRARAVRDVDYENWREGNGRKPKKELVKEWRENHPDGTKAECIRNTGLTKPTVYKWWS